MLELLIAAMIAIAGGEIHNIDEPAHADYRAGVSELARLNIEVSSEGLLVSPEVDAALLTGIQWYESRFRPEPPDGDCHMVGLGFTTRKVCSVQGPMQLMKGAGKLALFVGTRFEGMTNPEMKKPANNIAAAYRTLLYYKELCGGPPGVWVTAYGFGHCPKSHGGKHGSLHWEGARRCALITAVLESTRTKPEGWRCGHEGQSVLPHTRYLIRRLKRSVPPQPAAK
jgi:hypothetical protein